MKRIWAVALILFVTCNAKRNDQPATPPEPIMVGGPGTTTPRWCMEKEGPQGFRAYFSDGSKVYFCTTADGKTRYLASIIDPTSGLYHLGLQEKSAAMTIKHSGPESITFELPEPFDPQEKSWAAGPWLVWADPAQAPQGFGAYSNFCKTLKHGEGFLNEGSDGRLFLPKEFESRDTAIKFWYTATEPVIAKEYSFKELSNGRLVTLKVGSKYLNRTMVDVAPKKGVYYFMKPVKEVLSLEPSSQKFEVQSNQTGVFFMPEGSNKPGTRTTPGFGPFKIVPVDQKNPSLKQVYLQNALDPSTPQYVKIDAQGTDNRGATLENATIFCIEVE